jgi:phosphatidylserine/phosphatidylglycerophosphate/cardiolipin synthase-like enzyme
MSVVRVAIPLLKGKRRFFIAKGRPWSLVEHVFLAALVQRPRAVNDLATEGNVPRRLVLEALIRLMRAGWVAVTQDAKGVTFSSTATGQSVVDDEELPQVAKSTSRWMNFVVDKITGTVYRSRELPFLERHVVEERAKRERLVWLAAREPLPVDEAAGVLAALFDDDEKFLGIEPCGDRLVDRYAVVSVRNGSVEGLPPRAPKELEEAVLEAAKKAPPHPGGDRSPLVSPPPVPSALDRSPPAPIDAFFSYEDLIFGGPAHKDVLLEALRRAKTRIILHSTFISEQRFLEVQPLLHDAAKRGVLIDILWGENEEKQELVTTRKTVARLRERIDAAGLSFNLRIHPFSTRSHAKILVADDGRTGRLSSTVGSCNWLSSDFRSYEASVRFSDPNVVAAILEQVAELTRGSDGHWTELTGDVARLAAEARTQRVPAGVKAKVSIVLGPQHAQYVRMARDEAVRRVFVTSHRLGAATRAAVIVPAIAAVRDRGVEIKVYYGTPSGNVNNSEAARLTTSAGAEGVQIRPVIEPRLHAKLLAWDEDNLLVTSQNWLSADPSEVNVRREIGVFIKAYGVGRAAIEHFEASRLS